MQLRWLLITICLLFYLHIATAKADVGIFLSDPTGKGASRFTAAGHASIYLSNICPASPIRLRICQPGESGSVLSNYARLGEDKPYEWNIVSISIFLYGFEDHAERPFVASLSLKRILEERYRQTHLKELCSNLPCSADLAANWRDMVGTTFVRGLYLIAVKTTPQQDQEFVRVWNAQENANHYNGFTNNCANFVRRALSVYFPNSTSAAYLNDFGMASPKSVAHSFAKYAKRHPELGFYVTRFAQIPSERKTTGVARVGTEAVFHQKKWMLPLLWFGGYELPVMGTAYLLTGRYNLEKERQHYPVPSYAMERERSLALVTRSTSSSTMHKSRVAHSEQEWAYYRESLKAVQAASTGNPKDRQELVREVNRRGVVVSDPDGALWIIWRQNGKQKKIGAQWGNVLAPASDATLAFNLQLAKVERMLEGKPRNRELLLQFEQEWHLLEQLGSRVREVRLQTTSPGSDQT